MVRQVRDDVEHLERALIVKAMLGDVTDDNIENLSRAQSAERRADGGSGDERVHDER